MGKDPIQAQTKERHGKEEMKKVYNGHGEWVGIQIRIAWRGWPRTQCGKRIWSMF